MNILMAQLFRTDLRKRRAIMKFVPNESVLRVALTVFSVCFGILSVSLLVLGVVYINELQWPRSFIALDFLELPTLIIILGAVSLLLSFAGCVCAKSYNRPYYFLFALTLCLVLCLELTIAIIAFNNNTETRRSSTKLLMEGQILFNNNTAALEMLEKRYSCCGLYGTEDKCLQSNATVTGCEDALNDALDGIAIRIAYFLAGCSILQVLEIVCTFVICFTMKV